MICDLSIEALLRLARTQQRCSINRLNIPGLLTEHLTPLVTAGLLEKSQSSETAKHLDHAPRYHITAAGRAAIEAQVSHLRHLIRS
jgi:hypothetical protein